jgi:hypothetical protein
MIGAKSSIATLALVLFSLTALPALGQTTISQWNFNIGATVTAPFNSPLPTTGSGTATSLGMTNTYTYAGTTATNSVTSDDVLSSPGVANPSFSEYTWRIRGTYASTGTAPNSGTVSKSANVNGWNLSAPQYTQGVEFDASTVGYQNIMFSYDWYSTNQGVRDLQEQYNLDISNPSDPVDVWTNINPLQVAVPNDFDSATSPSNTIDLSSILGASNDPNLGIRLVSAYDPTYTGAGAPTYTSATLTGGLPVQYNNDSGNWRFGDITFSGTAVPEPASASIFAIGALGLALRRRRAAK